MALILLHSRIQREFLLHFHQSQIDSLNAYVEVFCSLVSLSCATSSSGHISRQNDSLFGKQSKFFQKLGTLIFPFHALDDKIFFT